MERFIALRTKQELSTDDIKTWFRAVKAAAPSGTVITVTTKGDDGVERPAALTHRRDQSGHSYLVPLSRDLSEAETEAIVNTYLISAPEADFDVETSSTAYDLTTGQVEVPDTDYNALCVAWAKRQHDDWMADRLANDWRYGPVLSIKNRTHPLLRPWDQLPEKFRKVNAKDPQVLMALLNDQGFAVIKKSELQALFSLIR